MAVIKHIAGRQTRIGIGVVAAVLLAGAAALGSLDDGSSAVRSVYSGLETAPPSGADLSRFAAFVDPGSARLVHDSANGSVHLAAGRSAGEVCRVTLLPTGAAGIGCIEIDNPEGSIAFTASGPNTGDGIITVLAPDDVSAARLSSGPRAPAVHNVAVFTRVAAPEFEVTLETPSGERTLRGP